MPYYNNATLMGYLTRDGELSRVGEKKTALLKFTIAVNNG